MAYVVERDHPAPPGAAWRQACAVVRQHAGRSGCTGRPRYPLLEWDRTHRFCGACATPTIRDASERAALPVRHHTAYPRISPAMMCLITRGREILLARNVNFPAGRYSALARLV